MSSLLISGTDVHGSYITIRNGGVHIVHLGMYCIVLPLLHYITFKMVDCCGCHFIN